MMTKPKIKNHLLLQEIDKGRLYYQALFMSFDEFIEEERKGQIFTELRLLSKIEAARKLYKKGTGN